MARPSWLHTGWKPVPRSIYVARPSWPCWLHTGWKPVPRSIYVARPSWPCWLHTGWKPVPRSIHLAMPDWWHLMKGLDATLLVMATGAACAVPGVFLVLRRLALIGDAIGHVLLLGIVVMYAITRDLTSPWLFVGAVLSGLLTVVLVEALQRTQLVQEDAAIGLVFPALFSLGTIIASLYFRDTHLDVDQVLLGHVEYIPFAPRVEVFGFHLGRQPTVILAGVFVLNFVLTLVLFKELKLSTFDPALAAMFGFAPMLLHYGLMTMVSLTTVAAFDAVGPVLVVAFLVLPALTARLFTHRLFTLILLSITVGVVGGFVGVRLAFALNTNIAGMTAVTLGGLYALALSVAPRQGWISQLYRAFERRREFLATMLTIHLAQHEGTPSEPDEAGREGVHRHLHWTRPQMESTIRRAIRRGWVEEQGPLLKLTPAGRDHAHTLFARTSET
ncbi:MAG: metal ABC transporter permease [Fimbriiglobus sp.]